MLLEPGWPGVPVLFPTCHFDFGRRSVGTTPFWAEFPGTAGHARLTVELLAGAIQRAALEMRGWRGGHLGGIPCLWVPASERCYRVQSAGLGVGLHGSQAGGTWYTVIGGMNGAHTANMAAGAKEREIVRQSLAEVAALPGCAQILLDPEVLLGDTRGELFPERSPIYSRDATPGANFTPSVLAVGVPIEPVDPGLGFAAA